jgi:hypothetical protein
MFRFTIRELVLAIALAAIVVAWFVDRLTLAEALANSPPRTVRATPLQNDE